MDLMLKVARLYYQENMTQQQIAKRLGISRVKVYRILLKAREEGIVKIVLQAPQQDFTDLAIKIENHFRIKECIIVPSSDSSEILFNGFGVALGSVFERYLKDGVKIGFGWGSTIRGTIERINISKKYNIKVFPTIGGLGSNFDSIHANSIVSLAASKLGGIGHVLNCPAILDSQSAKEMFLNQSSINDIVKEFQNLDLVVVPIGYMDHDITIKRAGHLTDEEIEYFKSLNIVGDINSNFIDINGNTVENRIQARIINVSLKTLKTISHTIALCYGEKKLMATKAALNSGAIDILITDTSIAEKLLDV